MNWGAAVEVVKYNVLPKVVPFVTSVLYSESKRVTTLWTGATELKLCEGGVAVSFSITLAFAVAIDASTSDNVEAWISPKVTLFTVLFVTEWNGIKSLARGTAAAGCVIYVSTPV